MADACLHLLQICTCTKLKVWLDVRLRDRGKERGLAAVELPLERWWQGQSFGLLMRKLVRCCPGPASKILGLLLFCSSHRKQKTQMSYTVIVLFWNFLPFFQFRVIYWSYPTRARRKNWVTKLRVSAGLSFLNKEKRRKKILSLNVHEDDCWENGLD